MDIAVLKKLINTLIWSNSAIELYHFEIQFDDYEQLFFINNGIVFDVLRRIGLYFMISTINF